MASAVPDDISHLRSEVERLQHESSHASTKDEALELAFQAADISMRALKLAKDSDSRKSISTLVQSILDGAERIKTTDIWTPEINLLDDPLEDSEEFDVSRIKDLVEPVSTRLLTRSEEILLLRASKLNGFKFPPWKETPRDSDFELKDGEPPFLDAPELRLSATQLAVLDDWKRSTEALPPPAWSTNKDDKESAGPVMFSEKSIDLVQDAATDCSVVASLCAGVARAERGYTASLSQVMYPYDSNIHHPRLSQNGRYIFRLNFNGTYRRVDIDDRLPVSKTSRILHVVDRHTPGLLWPALLEKAYLKVRGSYDFPGSNSGTDLWILFGWIPEQVFLQSDDTIPNQVWKRMYGAHKFGDVLVTMGTGKISSRAERETGLVGEHDYAVLDLREVDGQKLLLVKNPWCEGTSWTGSMPRIKASGETHTDLTHETSNEDEVSRSCRDLLNSDDQLTPGTFWMDLNSVIQHFESIYLNWNPGLFNKRQDLHFPWDLTAQADSPTMRGKYRSFAGNPQFRVTVKDGGTMWVLLCHHFRDAPSEIPDRSQIGSHQQDTQIVGFISLYAYDNEGSRVFLSDNPFMRGPFVDSPQTLLKLEDLQPSRPYTIVVAEEDLAPAAHTFTISAFANSAMSIEEAPSKYPYQQVISTSWTQETAGGNAHSPIYSQNPQFNIEVKARSTVSLLLETPVEHLNVHVKLVLGRGNRVESVRSRHILFDSKDYRRGCALATFRDVDAGTYTIICSTFEAGQTGPFTLRVDSTAPTILRLLPREGAGRMRESLAPASLHGQQYKVAAPLRPRRLSRMRVLVKHTNQSSGGNKASQMQHERSMIRVTIEAGRGPERRILIASANGEYSDSIAGVRTDEIDLGPEDAKEDVLWLVVERMSTPRELPEELFQVEMFVETPGAYGVGVWRKWDD